MRVLWIAQNGGNYKHKGLERSGGWIGAMQDKLMAENADIDLGIVFLSDRDGEELREGRVTYMPVLFPECKWRRRYPFRNLTLESPSEDVRIARLIKRKADSFNPDIIHVWGSENNIASVIPLLNKPFAVHIQGLATLFSIAYFPPGFSKADLKAASPLWKPSGLVKRLLKADDYSRYLTFLHQAERERKIAAYVKNWIGRTDWDREAVRALSPGSRYFHCEEVMRRDFEGESWTYHFGGTLNLQSNIGPQWYKGVDMVLRTAALLKEKGVPVHWRVNGIHSRQKMAGYISRKLGIVPGDVGVEFCGRTQAEGIKEGLLACDAYVHPSYAENSSNAIAEAMMLGVPTIAQRVGGNPTMLKDGSGVLVEAGHPELMASAIMEMRDRATAEGYSVRARDVAGSRQDGQRTAKELLHIYETVLKGQ